MTCHKTCIGPICTKANTPNRPLIGVARERQELMDKIEDAARLCYVNIMKYGSTSIALRSGYQNEVTEFLSRIKVISHTRPQWCVSFTLKSNMTEHTM